MITNKVFLSALLILSCASSAAAEDVNTIFQRVNDLIKAQNYSKALDELEWARKEVAKMHAERLKGFLPDQVAGYTGGKAEMSGALGILSLERTYTSPTSKVKVLLTGGASAGGGAALGGLAQIGQMAAMFGNNEPGKETIRVGGRTAMLESNEAQKTASLDVFLDGGAMLKLEQDGSAQADSLKTFADALKIDDIEKYLKGNS